MNELYHSGIDEHSSTVIEFESGVIATMHVSMIGTSLDNYLELVGTQGIIQVIGNEYEEQFVFLQSNQRTGYEKKRLLPLEEVREENPYPIEHFIDLVDHSLERTIADYDFTVAKRVTRLIECAYASAKMGQTIRYNTPIAK